MLSSRWPAAASAHATAVERRDLRLHAKAVPQRTLLERAASLVSLRDRMRSGRRRDAVTQAIRRFMVCVNELGDFDALPDLDGLPEAGSAELGDGDITTAADHGIVETDSDSAGSDRIGRLKPARPHLLRVFTTGEHQRSQKARRRWVSHPPAFNAFVEERRGASFPDGVTLPGHEIHARVAHFGHAKCLDLAFAFAQFLLPRRWRRRHTFVHDGKVWRQRIIPTGGSNSSQLCQEFLLSVALYVVDSLEGSGPEVDADVYIDNVRFLSSSLAMVDRAVELFYSTCAELAIGINEVKQVVLDDAGTTYDFLGVHYDHCALTTSLAQKSHTSLRALMGRLETMSTAEWEASTVRQLLSALGILQHGSIVLRKSRAPYYGVMKFFRRRASQGALLDGPARPWGALRHHMLEWCREVGGASETAVRRHWRGRTHDLRRAVLYTDASDGGYGAILFPDDGSCSIIAGRWSTAEIGAHINLKEAWALHYALVRLDLRGIHELEVRVDNTSVMYTVTGGSSKAFELNAAVGAIWALPQHALITSLSYVRSELNRSDFLSRLAPRRAFGARSNNPLAASAMERGVIDERCMILQWW